MQWPVLTYCTFNFLANGYWIYNCKHDVSMTSLVRYSKKQHNTAPLSKLATARVVPTLNLYLIPPWVRVPHRFWSWTKWPGTARWMSFLCSTKPNAAAQGTVRALPQDLIFSFFWGGYFFSESVWSVSRTHRKCPRWWRWRGRGGKCQTREGGLWRERERERERAQDNSAMLCNLRCRCTKSKKLFSAPNTYH